MIKSFRGKETEKIWRGIKSRQLPPGIQERALRKSRQLNASVCLQDLKMLPSNHLKQELMINGVYVSNGKMTIAMLQR